METSGDKQWVCNVNDEKPLDGSEKLMISETGFEIPP